MTEMITTQSPVSYTHLDFDIAVLQARRIAAGHGVVCGVDLFCHRGQ